MNYGFITDFAKKHTPPVLSILISIASSAYYLGTEIQDGFQEMKQDLVYEARLVTYQVHESSDQKQLEKLDKDPDDLKTTDVRLSYTLCHEEYGLKYIPSLPATRKADAKKACDKLSELYLNRSSY